MGNAVMCLDENVALDFLSGQLAPPELAAAEHHLAACESCVELLARSAPFLTAKVDPSTPKPRRELSPTLSTLAMKPPQNDLSPARLAPGEGVAPDEQGGDENLEMEEPPTLDVGTVLKDTYKVVGLVGRGGMGEVYEVTHARLAGRYALKLLPPAFAHEHVSVTRFRREADITSAMRHPNIVQVIDFNHTPAGQPFLVMEFLDGGDLAQVMAASGPMPIERVLPIVEQIVSALSAVHRRGIVHRDLKPQNVLLARGDDLARDRVKLVDFGLSKRNETSLFGAVGVNISRERTLLGTPRYMAPEQASGRIDEIDDKTDQFALGAIVYEMLTGITAFNGDNMALLLYRIVSEEPVPIRQLVPTIPEAAEQAVRRAMAKQKGDRFPSTRDFLVALAGGEAGWSAMPSGLGIEAVGRLTTPPASTAMSSSGAAAMMAAERVPNPQPPPRRSRALSFAVGLVAAIALAWGVQAARTRPPLAPASPSAAIRPPGPVGPAITGSSEPAGLSGTTAVVGAPPGNSTKDSSDEPGEVPAAKTQPSAVEPEAVRKGAPRGPTKKPHPPKRKPKEPIIGEGPPAAPPVTTAPPPTIAKPVPSKPKDPGTLLMEGNDI